MMYHNKYNYHNKFGIKLVVFINFIQLILNQLLHLYYNMNILKKLLNLVIFH